MLQRFLESSHHSSDPLVLQQVAYEFHQEVRDREAFDAYCEWYAAQARQHQLDLVEMQHDIPMFAWFSRHRR